MSVDAIIAGRKREMNIFKCHCNYQFGMGPNIQCPVHGTRENLHAGAVSRRYEIDRLEKEVEKLKETVHLQDWGVTCLRKLLKNVAKISDSRVIKIMIEQGLEGRDDEAADRNVAEAIEQEVTEEHTAQVDIDFTNQTKHLAMCLMCLMGFGYLIYIW